MYRIQFMGQAGNWETLKSEYSDRLTAECVAESFGSSAYGLPFRVINQEGLTESGLHFMGIDSREGVRA